MGKFGSNSLATITIDTSAHEVAAYSVGQGYMNLMGLITVAGRGFIEGSEGDANNAIIVNQEFVRQYYNGQNPVNKSIKLGSERKTIVGVMKDIIDDVSEGSEAIPSMILLARESEMLQLIVRTNHPSMDMLESELKEVWNELIDRPYNGQLQEDLALGSAVRDSENLQKIFLVMALLGGFLSLVGIFSLAKLNVARRFKEISIRKVLGASFKELLLSVNRSFVIVLGVSMLLGCVLGHLISEGVLSMVYKYYVDVSPLTSFLSGLLIVLFSLFIITLAVFVPSRANPVQGLREE